MDDECGSVQTQCRQAQSTAMESMQARIATLQEQDQMKQNGFREAIDGEQREDS